MNPNPRSCWNQIFRSWRWLSLLLVGACAPTSPAGSAVPAPDEVTLHILLTADFHGQLRPQSVDLGSGSAVEVGGPALLGGYVANLRRSAPGRVVLLDAGDVLAGSLEADLLKGRPVTEVYNLLGYDAMALGNHDLDFGQPALLAAAARASFPVLAANVVQADGQPWLHPQLRPSVLLERDGILIGVVGVATPETASTTHRDNVAGLLFQEPGPALIREAKQLRELGALLVLGLVHDGGNCKENKEVTDLASCEGELFQLARALPPGTVDLLAGGHTHGLVAKQVAGIPLIVPGAKGRWLGRVDLVVSRSQRQPLPAKTVIHPPRQLCSMVLEATDDCTPPGQPAAGPEATPPAPAATAPTPPLPLRPATYAGQPVAPDPAVQQALAPIFDQVRAIRERPLGVTAARRLTREYHQESELGNLICDALRWAVPEAPIALHNSGGIRAELEPGPLTYDDVYQVMPFDNRVALLTVTGAQLRALLDIGVSGRHGLAQVGGIRLVADPTQPDGQRIRELTLADGRPLDPTASYLVVTNDYLATGGSGHRAVLRTLPPEAIAVRETRLRDVIISYLEELGRQGIPLGDASRPLIDPNAPRIRLLQPVTDLAR